MFRGKGLQHCELVVCFAAKFYHLYKILLGRISSSLLATIVNNCKNITTIYKLICIKYKHINKYKSYLYTYTNTYTNKKVFKNAELIKAWVD